MTFASAASHVLPFPCPHRDLTFFSSAFNHPCNDYPWADGSLRADFLRSRAANFHATMQHDVFTEHKRATLAPEVDGGRWLTAAGGGIGVAHALGISPDMQGACFGSNTSAGFSGRRWKSKSGFKLVATDLDGTFMADTPNPPWVQASAAHATPALFFGCVRVGHDVTFVVSCDFSLWLLCTSQPQLGGTLTASPRLLPTPAMAASATLPLTFYLACSWSLASNGSTKLHAYLTTALVVGGRWSVVVGGRWSLSVVGEIYRCRAPEILPQ